VGPERDTRRAPVALLAAAVLEIGVVLAAVRWNLAGTWAQPLAERLVFLTAMVAVALLLGISVRVRRQAIDALTDRAARLERERDQQVALATAAERARIARDLHDVVAHSLSVMVTLSDAAALKAGSDPATAERTMQQVSATGRPAC
jgi:signal transduction histidine kinase